MYVVVRYAFARSKRESYRFRAPPLVRSTRRALYGVSLPPFFLHFVCTFGPCMEELDKSESLSHAARYALIVSALGRGD